MELLNDGELDDVFGHFAMVCQLMISATDTETAKVSTNIEESERKNRVEFVLTLVPLGRKGEPFR